MGYIKMLPYQDIDYTPLQKTMHHSLDEAYAAIELLPDNHVDERGNTLLHYASMYHDEYLLQKYAGKIDASIVNKANQDIFKVAINSYLGQLKSPNISEPSDHLHFLTKLLKYTNGSLYLVRKYYEHYSGINNLVVSQRYTDVFTLLYNHENIKDTNHHNDLLKNTDNNKQLISLLPLFNMPDLQFHILDNNGNNILHAICEKLKYVKDDPAPISASDWLHMKTLLAQSLPIKKLYYSHGQKADPVYYKTTCEYMMDKVFNHSNMQTQYMYIKNNDNISPYDLLSDEYKAKFHYGLLQKELPYHQGKSQRKAKI